MDIALERLEDKTHMVLPGWAAGDQNWFVTGVTKIESRCTADLSMINSINSQTHDGCFFLFFPCFSTFPLAFVEIRALHNDVNR